MKNFEVKNDTVILVPVLNEEAEIERFLNRWTGYGWDFLFVDGISIDRTVQKIEAYKAKVGGEKIEVVIALTKQGLAANSCLGLQVALDRGYEFVIVADVGTQVPEDGKKLLEIARTQSMSNLIIPRGSYFLPGSTVHDFPRYRRIVSRCAALVAGLILGKTGTYPTHAFKVWPRAALESIPFHGLLDGRIAKCVNGPEFQVGMTWLSLCHGWRVPEYPMEFHGTKSTFRWKWIPNYIRQLRKMRFYHGPKTVD